MSRPKSLFIIILIVAAVAAAGFNIWINSDNSIVMEKPVIYLYPTAEQQVSVKVDSGGEMLCTDPALNDGAWKVIANPDGRIYNLDDNQTYPYLFWEARCLEVDWDLSTGFIVAGKDTGEFLQGKLSEIGLTRKETDDFIAYWLPQMQDNRYNLIHFEGQAYENTVKLEVEPQPDSILRVFMVYKPVCAVYPVQPQVFPTFHRTGFTVVEWGGARL